MRVTHLSTVDVVGGAARAAYRLHAGLRERGIDSHMFVADKRGDDRFVECCRPRSWLQTACFRLRRRWIYRQMHHDLRNRPAWVESFSSDQTPYNRLVPRQIGRPDVFHLHWVAKFVDYRGALPALACRAPLVWTLHDMNPLTGGCHYDAECGRFNAGCGACPQLGSSRPDDTSARIWRRKQSLFSQIPPHRLHIVTLCHWMERLVRNSPLLGRFDSSVIPNGLDTDLFTPTDRATARGELGLPSDTMVVLFVADSTANARKGFPLLLQALKLLGDRRDLHLVSVGRDPPVIETNLPHSHLGLIDDEARLAKVYGAADVFVIPSLQDNLPNTVVEAMACGTPVAGFDAGGIPDMVRPGVTGALAPTGDVAALAAAIRGLLENDVLRRELGGNARRVAVAEYSFALQASRFTALYERLMQETSLPPGHAAAPRN